MTIILGLNFIERALVESGTFQYTITRDGNKWCIALVTAFKTMETNFVDGSDEPIDQGMTYCLFQIVFITSIRK